MGFEQKPLDGTSFAYSFGEAAAASRHRLQVFENLGNRAIYQDGWLAGARHSLPWEWGGSDDFTQDRWELYHLEDDFSQSRDLAKQYPEKLKALQAVFDQEARENDVYPLGNLFNANETSWREVLSPIAGKREFVYYPGTPRIDRFAPDFSQSHRLEAQLEIPSGGAEGVILANGGRHGGFALYVKDGRLVYENNIKGESRDVITPNLSLPRGKVTIAYELVREEDPSANTAKQNPTSSALLHLYINNRLAGEGRLARIGQRMALSGSLGIGQAFGSPVSAHFKPPFEFTGTLNEVRVVMQGFD